MGKLIKTVMFQAPRERIWAYLTEKDKLGLWYNPATGDLRVGEEYTLLDPGDKPLVWGRVLEMDPPARLVTSFCIAAFEGRESTVAWELAQVAGGTLLTLTHEGIVEAAGEAALPLLGALDKGWDGHLAGLRQAV